VKRKPVPPWLLRSVVAVPGAVERLEEGVEVTGFLASGV
jgi:hypothetical protein